MSANKKICNYFNKRHKVGKTKVSFKNYYGDKELNEKLDKYANDLNNGFDFYKKVVLEKFILGYKEIDDFSNQFILLNEYNKTNNKYSNTLEKFCINYGTTLGTIKFNQKKENMKGELNPFFNHGGKYSPLSDKFVGNSKKEDVIKKISKSNKENGNNDCTVLYWTNKGYTKSEAKIKIGKRQSTFSLKKCIKKYGLEKGQEVFNQRQIKWQNTLNSKSIEETQIINRKKGTGLLNKLFQSDPKVKKTPGILYYIRFYNKDMEFWKIGITSKTINERFNKTYNLKKEVIFETHDTFYNCYKKEQSILKKYNKYRINIDYNGFKTTEAFTKDIYAII